MKKADFVKAGVFSITLLGASITNASTISRVQIDEVLSNVHYTIRFCNVGEDCPIEKTYGISGTFDVIVDNDLISFQNINVSSPTIDTADLNKTVTFTLPEQTGIINGTQFYGSGDPCFLFNNYWHTPGTCSSIGWFGPYSGTFDGSHLLLDGFNPSGTFPAEYSFSIQATTVVPTPSSMTLLAVGLLSLWTVTLRSRLDTRRKPVERTQALPYSTA